MCFANLGPLDTTRRPAAGDAAAPFVDSVIFVASFLRSVSSEDRDRADAKRYEPGLDVKAGSRLT